MGVHYTTCGFRVPLTRPRNSPTTGIAGSLNEAPQWGAQGLPVPQCSPLVIPEILRQQKHPESIQNSNVLWIPGSADASPE
jgi:hypothetical protein